MLRIFAFFICIFSSLIAHEPKSHHQQHGDTWAGKEGFRISRDDYTFSTVFELAVDDKLVGTVYKGVFHVMNHYDLYNTKGDYEGTGICRFFTLGLFYTWATEIDIYDAYGNYVGMIDGQMASLEPAKFSLYDSAGKRTGIAYLDQNCSAFSVMHPEKEQRLLARFTRNFLDDTVDTWDVDVYEPNAISSQIIRVFAAFACDTQDKFKADKGVGVESTPQ